MRAAQKPRGRPAAVNPRPERPEPAAALLCSARLAAVAGTRAEPLRKGAVFPQEEQSPL